MSSVPFTSTNGKCQGIIITENDWNITLHGKVISQYVPKQRQEEQEQEQEQMHNEGFSSEMPMNGFVRYAASAPADIRMSRMGSGLPYPSEEVAYEGSPNVGEVPLKNGLFTLKLISPNTYYKDNGSKLIKPHVHFTIGNEYFDVPLPSAYHFPNRSLTSMPGRTNRVTGR